MDEPVEVIRARAQALVRSHREMMEELISLRDEHDLRQGEVGDRMGVSQSAVSQFERYDSNPTLATVRRYALAVGARIEYRVLDDSYAPAERTPPDVLRRALVPMKTPASSWGSSLMWELEHV